MPFNFKQVRRRKSAGNALDLGVGNDSGTVSGEQTAPSSFRVLDRADRLDGPGRRASAFLVDRPFASPLQHLRQQSAEELGNTLSNRASHITTHSGSSGHYTSSAASARHSSSSTLPSSLDVENHSTLEDVPKRLSARSSTSPSLPAAASVTTPVAHPDAQSPASRFSSRASGVFSAWSRSKQSSNAAPVASSSTHKSPTPVSGSPPRNRALTTSSYASTAKPDLALNLEEHRDTFADFSSYINYNSVGANTNSAEPVLQRAVTRQSPVLQASEETGNLNRRLSETAEFYRVATNQSRTSAASEADRRGSNTSNDYFLERTSSIDEAIGSPEIGSGAASSLFAGSRGAYSAVGGSSHSTAAAANFSLSPPRGPREIDGNTQRPDYPNRQAHLPSEDRWRRVELSDRTMASPANPERRPSRASFENEMAKEAAAEDDNDEPLFDTSKSGLRKIQQKSHSGAAVVPRAPRTMTKAQYDRLSRADLDQVVASLQSGATKDEEDEEEDEYEDDDDIERAKRMKSRRQKQEANLAVYRQKMKKVTGGDGSGTRTPTLDPRVHNDEQTGQSPGLYLGGASASTPPAATVRGKQSDDDEDDDVPLGILQAHGFPSSSRPPLAPITNDSSRRMSSMGLGATGAGEAMPPFARKLPADPYFGSSIVNSSKRESLGMHSQSGFAYSEPSQYMHPGGLVGVIAGEERAKAARRGSPNPITGSYAAPPLSYTNQPMMHQMSQQVPLLSQQRPASAQDPMQVQLMQMQMQVMQKMLEMQQHQQQQQQQQREQQVDTPQSGLTTAQHSHDYFSDGVPLRSTQSSGALRPAQSRPMSMMGYPDQQHLLRQSTYGPIMTEHHHAMSGANGYAASIAPSERSNVGMPSRYRPVSMLPGSGRNSPSLASIANNSYHQANFSSPDLWRPIDSPNPQQSQQQQRQSMLRTITQPKSAPGVVVTDVNGVDADEDEGWAAMRQKREQRKHKFRLSRDKE